MIENEMSHKVIGNESLESAYKNALAYDLKDLGFI